MTDFTAIRRRAESMQENSGLGTPEHAISQDVLELLDLVKSRREHVATIIRGSLEDAVRDAEAERDEARELHAKVCAQYGEAASKLNTIHWMIERWRKAHPVANVDRDGAPGHSIACGNVEESMVAMAGMIDCGKCGDVHGVNSQCDPEAVAMSGASVGPVPHE